MSSVNKFYPINIQNTNNITGTYGNVSLLVNADEEVKGNLFVKNTFINTTNDPSYSLICVGDVSLNGKLWLNGTQITGGGGGGTQNLASVLSYGNKASTDIDMSNNSIINCSVIQANKAVFNQMDASSSFVEKLTFSNISSDIAITNWNASTPAYGSNGYYLQYGGTGTYTGLSGFIFSGTGYQVYILRGINNGVFFLTYFPPGITTNQCFVLQTQQNQTINAKTINYTLQAGGYTFGFWMQSSVGGTGQFLDWDVYVKNSSNVVLGQLMNLAPSNAYPNWVFYTINFNLTAQTTIYFEFQSSSNNYIYGGYVCLVGLELTLNNSILVRDTASGKTATISGAQSILNAVSVNDGISINNGGLNVIGGIKTTTATGSSNTTINTTLGQTSNPVNNVAIGDSALQTGTTASQNVVIGVSAVPFATTISNNVAIGFNANLGTTTEKSVVIGSRQIVRGNNTIAIGNFDFIGTTQGAIGQNCVGIGSNILGANVQNGFGVLSTQDSVAIGNSSQYNCTDRFNNSIGVESLFNLNGRNGVVANSNSGRITQYNNAFGYRAGYNQQRYNNCTFIGALADASVDNLFNSVAIGHNCQVDASNVIQIGSNSELVRISGALRIGGDLSNITTINGQPYVPGGGGAVGTLSQVLTNGNNANGLGIINLGASNMNGQLDISGNVFINNTTLYITRGGGSLSTDGTSRINHWDYATSIESNFISEANNNSFNLSIGKNTPNVNKIGTGYSNRIETIAVGYNALSNLTTGESNTALGVNAGMNTTTGSNNTFIGRYAGDASNYNNCTFIGAFSDGSGSNLRNSVAIGHSCIVDSSFTIQLGSNGERVRISGPIDMSNNNIRNFSNLVFNTQTDNIYTMYYANDVSHNAIFSYRGGAFESLCIGQYAGKNMTTELRPYNTLVGAYAGERLEGGGHSNTGVGLGALRIATSGNSNCAIGYNSLKGITSGLRNIGIGYYAGANSVGLEDFNHTNSIFLGYASTGTTSLDNSILIGNETRCDLSNTIILGRNMHTTQIQGGFIPASVSLAITGTTTLTNTSLGSTTYLVSSTGSNTINLPPTTNRNGATITIYNQSSHKHTLASTANIGGGYGSNTTTQVLTRGQGYLLVLNSGQWRVIQVFGVPYSYVRYHNNSQTIGTGVVSALFNTAGGDVDNGNSAWNLDTWNGQRLDYNSTTGVFTNNTGHPMTIQVETYAVANPTSATRYIGILPSATRQASNTIWYSGAAGTSGVIYSNYTFYLGNTETFVIQYQASATGITYGTTTPGANSNRIIITRIS